MFWGYRDSKWSSQVLVSVQWVGGKSAFWLDGGNSVGDSFRPSIHICQVNCVIFSWSLLPLVIQCPSWARPLRTKVSPREAEVSFFGLKKNRPEAARVNWWPFRWPRDMDSLGILASLLLVVIRALSRRKTLVEKKRFFFLSWFWSFLSKLMVRRPFIDLVRQDVGFQNSESSSSKLRKCLFDHSGPFCHLILDRVQDYFSLNCIKQYRI